MEQKFKKLNDTETKEISGGTNLTAGFFNFYSFKRYPGSNYSSICTTGPFETIEQMEESMDNIGFTYIKSGKACEVKCTAYMVSSDGNLYCGMSKYYPSGMWSY